MGRRSRSASEGGREGNGGNGAASGGGPLRMRDLQALWRTNPEAAWRCIADHARSRIPRRNLRSRSKNGEPDDWVSEVLLRVFADDAAALRRARPDTEVAAWIAGVVKRVVAADGRTRAKHDRIANGTGSAARARGPRGEYLQFPRSSWTALTARQQQVLRHRVEGGLTLGSTASVLEISVSSVRKLQRAALHQLHRNAAASSEAASPGRGGDVGPVGCQKSPSVSGGAAGGEFGTSRGRREAQRWERRRQDVGVLPTGRARRRTARGRPRAGKDAASGTRRRSGGRRWRRSTSRG